MSIEKANPPVKTYLLRFLGTPDTFDLEIQALTLERPEWHVEILDTSSSLATLVVPNDVLLSTPGVFGGKYHSLIWEIHEYRYEPTSRWLDTVKGICPLRMQHYLSHHGIAYEKIDTFTLAWKLPLYQTWYHDPLVQTSTIESYAI
jgi:hypothetical protein